MDVNRFLGLALDDDSVESRKLALGGPKTAALGISHPTREWRLGRGRHAALTGNGRPGQHAQGQGQRVVRSQRVAARRCCLQQKRGGDEAAAKDEGARSQPGMLMISTGATFFHAWHLTGGHIAGQVAYGGKPKRLLRAPAMINWSDGMNDLKAYTLLKDVMAKAPKDSKALAAAKSYLDATFKVFNGDHRDSWTLQPYLGAAFQWGYERFYDDWQEAMLKHAAAIKGVKWIHE